MKKAFSVLLTLVMVFSIAQTGTIISSAAIPSGYTGIYTPTQLNDVRNTLSGNYILMNDIDLSAATSPGGAYYNSGKGWSPIGLGLDSYKFTGVFDGNGYKIIGLNITGNNPFAGLFEWNSGTIKNLTLFGGNINVVSTESYSYVGGIASVNDGTINNCKSSCNISLEAYNDDYQEDNYYYAGGIAAANSGTISNCSNSGSVDINIINYSNVYSQDEVYVDAGGIAGSNDGTISKCSNSGLVEANAYADGYAWVDAGGLTGETNGGNIDNCYNTGGVSASSHTDDDLAVSCSGGISGYNESCNISRCYNVGAVSTFAYSEYNDSYEKGGGIAGQCFNDDSSACTVVYCYYSNTGLDGVGTGTNTATYKTTSQMKQQSSFTGFDFTNIWFINSSQNNSYPQLQQEGVKLVTGITLTAATITLIPGKTSRLTAAITPVYATNKSVNWSSSNNSIAVVDSTGLITAKAKGTVTITCTAKDGSNKTAACSVSVGKAVTSLILNATSLKWAVGKSGTLAVTVSPSDAINKAVSWASSNVKVASVDSYGKVKAVGAGSATISCSAKDGSGFKAICKIYVTSVKLNYTSLKLIRNRTVYLKATVSPSTEASKGVTWSSSNKSVVSVDSTGKIKTIAYGSATITCTSKNGTGAKATCTFTVGKSVSKITLNTSSITWYRGKTGSFSVTVSPSDAINKSLSWSSSNTKVATIDSTGKVKAVGVGTATITCATKDGSGVKTTCKITVKRPPLVGAPSACSFETNYLDGLDLTWLAPNNSGKTINYYTVTLYYTNPVGDPAYDEITGLNYTNVRYVGPIYPGEDLIIYKTVGYSAACSKITLGEIKLEYSDRTTETFWYGYNAYEIY